MAEEYDITKTGTDKRKSRTGCGTGQLNEELKEKSWLTVKANRKLIFQTSAEDIWKESLKHLGGDYEMMIHFPTDPQLN